MIKGHSLAVAAGICAALASTAAKLAMASDATKNMCTAIQENAIDSLYLDDEIVSCDKIVTYVRIGFFAQIFLFNAMMWTFFVKSLQKCSSIVATATNTASNFFFTAVIGHLLFKESLPLLWWTGASIIITGLILIYHGQEKSKEKVNIEAGGDSVVKPHTE